MTRKNFNVIDRMVRRLRSRQVTRYTSPGDRVIDVGCGQQNWLVNSVPEWASESLGIDPNLRPEHQGDNGTTESIEEVVADSGRRFDTALSVAVIEHLDPQDAPQHVALIRETLRPGGKIVLTTPSPRSKPLLEFLAFRLRLISADEIADHKYYYPLEEIRDLVSSAGFDIIDAKTFQFGLNQVVVARQRT